MRRSVPRRPLTPRRGINPTLLFFLLGLVLLVVGIALPGFDMLVLTGGFVVLTYVITFVLWALFGKS